MPDILYNIIIYPLVQILDLAYLFFFRIFDNHGISIIGVSLSISVLTLPLYFEAEKWQKLERSVHDKLADKIAKIKSVFHGDEQYMVLSAYYRQNRYHPIYSLRGSIGLLLQIPFFIAAYHYLSNLDTLPGTSFLGIPNLGEPDSLLGNINILPLLMTFFNLASSAIYISSLKKSSSQGTLREKIQFLGMALIFLLLLYNSPSGLVLYWTFNNVFSLFKNILQKTKYSRFIIYTAVCLFSLLAAVYVLFFHHGVFFKRLIIAGIGLLFITFPLYYKYLKETLFIIINITKKHLTAVAEFRTILFSSLILFFLIGIIIPSLLINSSVAEFSFIEQYSSPLSFILITACQAFGFFIFWVFCVYFILSKEKRYFLTLFITIISFFSLLNTFLFTVDFGTITIDLQFSRFSLITSKILSVINILALLVSCALIVFLLFCRHCQIIQSCQIILLIAFFASGLYYPITINNKFNNFIYQQNMDQASLISANSHNSIYEFSKTGKNVLIIMMDRAMPGFVTQVFYEKPELNECFSGFVFYPNTISFATYTFYGAPPIFGGYDYAPAEINTRSDEILLSKRNESFLVLPVIFMENNYNVTITDPPLENDNIQNFFASYPEIKAVKIMTNYTDDWLLKHPDVQLSSIASLLKNRLIYFSFLRCAPVIIRHFIYDHGKWLAAQIGNTPLKTIQYYSMMDYLPEITSFPETENNTLTILFNDLPHEPAFLQAPEYTIPPVSSTNKGNGPFAMDYYFHINAASLSLLGKWFIYLKENNVYDNTRIIIVSDHGANAFSNYNGNIILPTGECLQNYAALLLFKDFNAKGNLVVDDQFMVNADTSILATDGIINNPVNPFNGKPLLAKKDNGVTITSSNNTGKPPVRNRYFIKNNEWLHVHTNIFEPKNWKKTNIE
jgi:YidC/Oxa1 family membrane protein insertase